MQATDVTSAKPKSSPTESTLNADPTLLRHSTLYKAVPGSTIFWPNVISLPIHLLEMPSAKPTPKANAMSALESSPTSLPSAPINTSK